ncbi:hypothetical protein BOX15_Mlig021084g3 [Macrostomum lignano]|uniref:Reverse transcriptase domain-containing protein n=1 Tax=Macrostomum lignano TaxID=282301 RepID=A0A267DLS1_9PLAT|nr:hypothetical protein BOX15_Mlig021084g3 [Macrostomum lignano]
MIGPSDQELSNGALATKEGRVCTPAFCTSTSAPGKINATKSSPEDDSRRCRGTATGASTVAAGGIGCAFGYSGPRSLKCLQCEELVKTENEGREHAKSKHLSESVTIWCCKCNAFNRANLKGVVSHWGSCKGPVAVVAPGAGTSSTADSDPGDAAPHVCKFCERAFTTATGLGLHVQKSHKDEHNKALPTKKIFKYEDAEVKDLARAELTLRTKGRVNIELQKMFPHRTVQSIANLRKSEKYRSFLDEARSELEQTPSVASTTDDEVSTLPETVAEEEHQEMAEEPADAEELILEGIKAAINFFVSKYEFGPDSLKREVARYLKEGLVDSDCWSELEPLLKDAWFIKEEHGQKKAKRKPKSKSLPRLKRTGRAFHRREKYAICQKSLDKDFSGTISKILDGVEISEAEVRPEMAKIEEVYQQRLGNTSGALPENTDTPVVEGLRFERKTAPFDAQEVTRAIRESNKSTAAGPDRWFNGRCLKNLDCETVAALFNLWRFKQKIPSALRENRTILLPKGGDLTDANNWRPLTIGSLLLRLYAKSLTTRWSDAPICERQKAFRPVDGCWENINLLLGALKSAHKKRRQINLISIDLAKAFDNIQHGAIFNAMRRFGFSPSEISVVKDLYTNVWTKISIGNEISGPINISRGVKQGCPLSPFLFNLVLDELINELQSSGYGYPVEGFKVPVLAYADDLILCGATDYETKRMVEITEKFFARQMLAVNLKKCKALRLLPVKGKRTLKVSSDPMLWKGEQLPMVKSIDDFISYLGVKVSVTGKVIWSVDQLRLWLDRVMKAPLKPDQKIKGIKEVLIGRLTYQLRLSEARVCELRRVTRMVRKACKQILHMQLGAPNAWAHLPLRKCGLGLPDFELTIPLMRRAACEKMKSSPDPVVANISEKIPTYESGLTRGLDVRAAKRAIQDKYEQAYLSTQRGKLMNARWISAVKPYWLHGGTGVVKAGEYVSINKLVTRTIETRQFIHPGVTDFETLKCRRCGKAVETDLHVLNECPFTRLAQCRRHNFIADYLGKVLVDHGWEVWRERLVKKDLENFKPDLICRKGAEGAIIDVTVPYESNEAVLQSKERFKEAKYAGLKGQVAELLNINGGVKVVGIAVGALGTILTSTLEKAKGLGLDPVKVGKSLQISALRGSGHVWKAFRS